jgi:hypothetical protein
MGADPVSDAIRMSPASATKDAQQCGAQFVNIRIYEQQLCIYRQGYCIYGQGHSVLSSCDVSGWKSDGLCFDSAAALGHPSDGGMFVTMRTSMYGGEADGPEEANEMDLPPFITRSELKSGLAAIPCSMLRGRQNVGSG